MRRLFLAVLAAALLSPPPTASAQARSRQEAEIAAQIRLRGDDSFRARTAAVKALVRIGMPARPALVRAVRTSRDPEVRQRAKDAVEGIDEVQGQRHNARINRLILQLGSDTFKER